MMPVYSYGMNTDADGSYTGLTASADYQHSFKRKGRFLTLSYKFDYNPNNSSSETEYVDVVDVPLTSKGSITIMTHILKNIPYSWTMLTR